MSDGNRTATRATDGTAHQFTDLLANSGKWMARFTLVANTHDVGDTYFGLYTIDLSSYVLFVADGTGPFTSGFSSDGPLTLAAGDVLDLLYDGDAGVVVIRKNGTPACTVTIGTNQAVYPDVVRGPVAGGTIVWTIAAEIPTADVPSGYTVR